MRVSFLLSLFREDIVRALFWTLVHSLWQGLALAILTGLVILFTRRSAPVLRYNILLGLLCLFVTGVGVTFCLALKGSALPSEAHQVRQATYFSADPSDTPVATALFVSERSLGERLVGYFNQKANLNVAIWFIILCIHLMKLVTNLGKVQRLRYYRTSSPDEYWKQRVAELAGRIGIKKKVELLESSLVRVPMMAGLLKPVILTPLGLLTQLPPQQVEAILLHELAHIRRKDYLVNLLQSLAEMLFFFNPAVIWISSLIREERENCCDDIAVGETRSKKEFIHALVSFQEYRPAAASHALAFAGGKNYLLQRVKRIVHHDNKTLDIREKFFLLACLFITAGLTLAYSRHTPNIDAVAVRPAAAAGAVGVVSPVEEGSAVRVVKPVHTATAATPVSGEKAAVRAPKTLKLPELGDTLLTDTLKKPQPGKDTLDREEEGRTWKSIPEQQREAMRLQQARLNEARMQLIEKEHELAVEQEKLNEMTARAHLESLNVPRRETLRLQETQLRLEQLRDQESLRLLQSEKLLDASSERLRSATRLRSEQLLANQQHLEAAHLRLEAARLRLDHSSLVLRQSVDTRNKTLQPIIEMLQAKKLISSTDELSFSLDNDGLIVNDKKQPDDVFQSFREAFIHSSKDYVKYSKHGNSESSSINQHKD